jgi:hypothetical protein
MGRGQGPWVASSDRPRVGGGRQGKVAGQGRRARRWLVRGVVSGSGTFSPRAGAVVGGEYAAVHTPNGAEKRAGTGAADTVTQVVCWIVLRCRTACTTTIACHRDLARSRSPAGPRLAGHSECQRSTLAQRAPNRCTLGQNAPPSDTARWDRRRQVSDLARRATYQRTLGQNAPPSDGAAWHWHGEGVLVVPTAWLSGRVTLLHDIADVQQGHAQHSEGRRPAAL